jgi:hypothetical protein
MSLQGRKGRFGWRHCLQLPCVGNRGAQCTQRGEHRPKSAETKSTFLRTKFQCWGMGHRSGARNRTLRHCYISTTGRSVAEEGAVASPGEFRGGTPMHRGTGPRRGEFSDRAADAVMRDVATAQSIPDESMQLEDITTTERRCEQPAFASTLRWTPPLILPGTRSPILLRPRTAAMLIGATTHRGHSPPATRGFAPIHAASAEENPIVLQVDQVPTEDHEEPFDFTNEG